MFEVESSAHIVSSGADCEMLIMTGKNEYLELMGSIDDYENINFDFLNSGEVRNIELPPMFRTP